MFLTGQRNHHLAWYHKLACVNGAIGKVVFLSFSPDAKLQHYVCVSIVHQLPYICACVETCTPSHVYTAFISISITQWLVRCVGCERGHSFKHAPIALFSVAQCIPPPYRVGESVTVCVCVCGWSSNQSPPLISHRVSPTDGMCWEIFLAERHIRRDSGVVVAPAQTSTFPVHPHSHNTDSCSTRTHILTYIWACPQPRVQHK